MIPNDSTAKNSGQGAFGRSFWFAFFAPLLLWLCVITLSSGSISWSVHSLLLLVITTGLFGLQRKTGLVSTAVWTLRKILQSRSLVSLGRATRDAFVNLQRVPIHVALSIGYLVALFGTAIFLFLTMTN